MPRTPSVVLIGCVKTKLSEPAPAKDLYISPLFARRRRFAELSTRPWFVLSSQWGLIDPGHTIAPYDMYLADQPAAYRQAWGRFVVEQLRGAHPIEAGSVVEIHAGQAYVAALRSPLESLGLVITNPVEGTSLGQIMQWYDANDDLALAYRADNDVALAYRADNDVALAYRADDDVADRAVDALSDESRAIAPTALDRVGSEELSSPGLYAWWVDAEGAATLSTGLGTAIEAGLVYVGEAGATRQRSGMPSKNTLKARLNGILKGNIGGSTFRQSLDAILRRPLGLDDVDEARLGAWMNDHLRVTTWATTDADILGPVAARVVQLLDPPLNIQQMAGTDIRSRLTELRRAAAQSSARVRDVP